MFVRWGAKLKENGFGTDAQQQRQAGSDPSLFRIGRKEQSRNLIGKKQHQSVRNRHNRAERQGSALCSSYTSPTYLRILRLLRNGRSYISVLNENYGVDCTIFKGKIRAATTLGEHLVGTELSNDAIVKQVLIEGKQYQGTNIINGIEYYSNYSLEL